MDIIADGKPLATPCDVFRKDLCLPLHRAARIQNETDGKSVAMAIAGRVCGPLREATSHQTNLPFDSGAFHQRRLHAANPLNASCLSGKGETVRLTD